MTTVIHDTDIGTIFSLTVKDSDGTVIDVSTASTKYIYFQKPDRTRLKKTAAFRTDGSDGQIGYVAISGDIDQVGEWQVQGYVETSDGKFFTEVESFTVKPTIYTAS